MDNYELLKILEHIGNDVTKIQSICKLSVDYINSKTDPDIQTALYIITDYADRIKELAGKNI